MNKTNTIMTVILLLLVIATAFQAFTLNNLIENDKKAVALLDHIEKRLVAVEGTPALPDAPAAPADSN